MKNLPRQALVAAFLLAASSAEAISLSDAATAALQNDPRLVAADQSVQASAANVDVARAGYRPTVNASVEGGRSRLYTSAVFPIPGSRNPLAWGVVASQPLYTGGLVGAQIDSARSQLDGAREFENGTRQQLLLNAGAAYLDVIRDRAIIELNRTTVETLTQAQTDTAKRFKAGEATKTDVAQADARVHEAQASLQRAIANAAVGAATFRRVIGRDPDALDAGWPDFPVPTSLDAALTKADDTPGVRAANAETRAARAQISAAKSGYLPRLSIEGEASDADDQQFTFDRQTYWSIQLKATLPIYQGGATRARVSAARAQAAQAQAQADDMHRATVEAISQAWAQWQATAEVIKSYESDVAATELALDSVRKELAAGTRTTLNLLDAERDYLSARVNLAVSRHDRAVAALQLLAATGELRLDTYAKR